MSIILYQFPISHFCEKVRWALDYKGIQYRRKNLLPGTHGAVVRKLAPKTTVPVLVHNGEVIQGSSSILDYLDTAFPAKPLLPKEQELATDVMVWENRLDAIAGPAIRRFCYHHLLQKPDVVVPLLSAGAPFYVRWIMRLGFHKLEDAMRRLMDINHQSAKQSEQQLTEVLQELVSVYRCSRYLVGDRFTRADLTACALFAPLFQPAKYPVPWVAESRLPSELRRWLSANESSIETLSFRYLQHR